jgi:phenylpropionate dioxygenase-like ring-hydroxylating dioxygenase large terminal subunit
MKELPGEAYTSEQYARLERATVLHRNWVHAAGAQEVAEPGDVLPVGVAGMPIVLVRQRDGGLRGFHNVCRHRAARLLTGETGSCARIVSGSNSTATFVSIVTSFLLTRIALRLFCSDSR